MNKILIMLLVVFLVGCTQSVEIQEDTISAEELALHNNSEDCWVESKGIVYDITKFLSEHESPLVEFCGSSIEEAYMKAHEGTKDTKMLEWKVGSYE